MSENHLEWYQKFKNYIVKDSNRRWKQRYPEFRKHSDGDKKIAYQMVKGICQIPRQYAFITNIDQITPELVRGIPHNRFVVKDCLGHQGKLVLCMERYFDDQTQRILYKNHLNNSIKTRNPSDYHQVSPDGFTCHELVRYIKEVMSYMSASNPTDKKKHVLRASGKARMIIEEFVRPIPSAGSEIPPDYKVYWVAGKVRAVHLFWRFPHGNYEAAFTNQWQRVPLSEFYYQYEKNAKEIGYNELPDNFIINLPPRHIRNKLFQTVRKLGQKHKALFCRYDFYIDDERILLGEITPVCGGLKNFVITKAALARFYPKRA